MAVSRGRKNRRVVLIHDLPMMVLVLPYIHALSAVKDASSSLSINVVSKSSLPIEREIAVLAKIIDSRKEIKEGKTA